MSKPTYYLWKNDFQTEEAFQLAKNKYTESGFRVVIFYNDSQEFNCNELQESNLMNQLLALTYSHFICASPFKKKNL